MQMYSTYVKWLFVKNGNEQGGLKKKKQYNNEKDSVINKHKIYWFSCRILLMLSFNFCSFGFYIIMLLPIKACLTLFPTVLTIAYTASCTVNRLAAVAALTKHTDLVCSQLGLPYLRGHWCTCHRLLGEFHGWSLNQGEVVAQLDHFFKTNENRQGQRSI